MTDHHPFGRMPAGDRPPQRAPSAELQALAEALGTAAVAARSMPMGDASATVQLRLADHRVVAARRLNGPDALTTGERLVQRSDRLHEAGIPVAWPTRVCASSAAGSWLVSPWLDGVVGSDRLDEPEATEGLASAMGSLQRRLAAVDPTGLELERDWADPERLVDCARSWAREVGPAGDLADLWHTTGIIERFGSMGAGALAWDPVVAHGDLVPVNVIVRPDGSLALLDLFDLHLAPRIFDIAWWGWVVRYHHPAAWEDGWPILLATAGIERDREVEAVCLAIGRLRCLQRAARAPAGAVRSRWLRRLSATSTW